MYLIKLGMTEIKYKQKQKPQSPYQMQSDNQQNYQIQEEIIQIIATQKENVIEFQVEKNVEEIIKEKQEEEKFVIDIDKNQFEFPKLKTEQNYQNDIQIQINFSSTQPEPEQKYQPQQRHNTDIITAPQNPSKKQNLRKSTSCEVLTNRVSSDSSGDGKQQRANILEIRELGNIEQILIEVQDRKIKKKKNQEELQEQIIIVSEEQKGLEFQNSSSNLSGLKENQNQIAQQDYNELKSGLENLENKSPEKDQNTQPMTFINESNVGSVYNQLSQPLGRTFYNQTYVTLKKMLVFEKTLEQQKQKKQAADCQRFLKWHTQTRRKSLPNEIRLMEATMHSDSSNESKPQNSIMLEQMKKVFMQSCGPIKNVFKQSFQQLDKTVGGSMGCFAQLKMSSNVQIESISEVKEEIQQEGDEQVYQLQKVLNFEESSKQNEGI